MPFHLKYERTLNKYTYFEKDVQVACQGIDNVKKLGSKTGSYIRQDKEGLAY